MALYTLGVFERLNLLNILPERGDFLTLKIMRQLREELSFDEAEIAALEFNQDGGRVRWKSEADKPKQIEIGARARETIAEILKGLDAQKQLQNEHMQLYERFVLDGSN